MKKISPVILTMCLVICVCFLLPGTARSSTIRYEVTQLDEDQGLWQYSYDVSDYTFNAGYGFSVYFDVTLYANVGDSWYNTANDGWALAVYPSVEGPYGSWNALFDAQAITDGAPTSEPFTISFVWLGSGAPGSQYFEVWHSDDDSGVFTILENGDTTPVPEPSTWSLFALGLLGIGLCRWRSRRA